MTLHDQVRNPRSSARHVLEHHARDLEGWWDRIAAGCANEPVRPHADQVPWSPIGHAVSALLSWELGGDVPGTVAAVARRCGPVAVELAELVSSSTTGRSTGSLPPGRRGGPDSSTASAGIARLVTVT